MPVDSKHPAYADASTKWKRARDLIAGEDAVKASGEAYLPKLGNESDDEYNSYKQRADFFAASGRTLEAFLGMVFRKPMTLKLPASLEPLTLDATLNGSSLQEYGKRVFEEVLTVGRGGTLVEFADVDTGRAFFAQYRAEQIINWRSKVVAGKRRLTLVVLDEMVHPDDLPAGAEEKALAELAAKQAETEDDFEEVKVRQLRVLRLDTLIEPVGYKVEIYRENTEDGKKEWALIATVVPTRRAKPLDFIPFVFHTPSNIGEDIERPPLEDIILKNLSHWRTSADLEHGRHFVAMPTPWCTGVAKSGELRIGSGTAWEIESENAKVGMLEFTGAGLSALEKAMEQKEHHMAVLGAKMLEAPKRAAETAEVYRIKAAGEGTSLTDLTMSMSESLTVAARYAAWWQAPADTKLDAFEDVKVALNTEFVSMTLTPDEMKALVAAYQANTMSRDTVIENFARGGLLPPDVSPEDEGARIDAQAAATGMKDQKPPGGKPTPGKKPEKGAAK